MPQFDPATFPPQLFWLVVSFIVLYWVVSKLGVARIGEVLASRARLIQDDLDRAAQFKADTDKAAAAYEHAMAEARTQAQDHMRSVTAEMKAAAEARTAAVNAELADRIGTAETRIAAAKREALDGLKALAGDTARDVVAKLAALSADDRQIDAAVVSALKSAATEPRS